MNSSRLTTLTALGSGSYCRRGRVHRVILVPLLLSCLASCSPSPGSIFAWDRVPAEVAVDSSQNAVAPGATVLNVGKPAAAKSAKVNVEKLDDRANSMMSDVEVLWQIPRDHVDGFLLRYGYNRDRLTNEVKVPVAELDIYDDPKYGEVYRLVLPGVTKDRPTFISIAAYTGDRVSAPSAPFEVQAQ